MTPKNSSYDDLAAPADMHADCRAASARLAQAARRATRPAPSIHFADQPRELPKPGIDVSEAAAALAAAIYDQ